MCHSLACFAATKTNEKIYNTHSLVGKFFENIIPNELVSCLIRLVWWVLNWFGRWEGMTLHFNTIASYLNILFTICICTNTQFVFVYVNFLLLIHFPAGKEWLCHTLFVFPIVFSSIASLSCTRSPSLGVGPNRCCTLHTLHKHTLFGFCISFCILCNCNCCRTRRRLDDLIINWHRVC